MADDNYDRKIDDAPVSLFKEKGALEVDYQRGHVSPPDGGPDIAQALTFALKDGKDWFEVSFDGRDMSRVARDLGVALLKTFDPALLALLPLVGEVTEDALEREIDDLPARATKKEIELIIAQIINFAADDEFVEERLLEALKKKLKTTGAMIKAAVKGVRDNPSAGASETGGLTGGPARRTVVAPSADEYDPPYAAQMEGDDDNPLVDERAEIEEAQHRAETDPQEIPFDPPTRLREGDVDLRREVEEASRTGRAGEFVEDDRPTMRDSRDYDDRDRAYDGGDDRR